MMVQEVLRAGRSQKAKVSDVIHERVEKATAFRELAMHEFLNPKALEFSSSLYECRQPF